MCLSEDALISVFDHLRDKKTSRPAAQESAPASVQTDGKNEQRR